MTTTNSGKRISLAEAQDRLPGPQGELSVGVFEHGSLVVKLYAPRGHDDQTPHSRDEIYVVGRAAEILFVAALARPLCRTMSCSQLRASNIGSKISVMIFRFGSSFMGRKAAR
jgi:hypothetical protein